MQKSVLFAIGNIVSCSGKIDESTLLWEEILFIFRDEFFFGKSASREWTTAETEKQQLYGRDQFELDVKVVMYAYILCG